MSENVEESKSRLKESVEIQSASEVESSVESSELDPPSASSVESESSAGNRGPSEEKDDKPSGKGSDSDEEEDDDESDHIDLQEINLEDYKNTEKVDEDDPLDQCPPDFEWAKIHGKANKVNNIITKEIKPEIIENEANYCKCCRLPTDKLTQPFELCTNVLNLEDLGAGFPLYYQFKSFTIVMYIFMIIIAGIAGIAINYDKDRGEEWDQDSSFIVKTSIGNHGMHYSYYDRQPVHVMQILNSIIILIVFVGGAILIFMQNKVINQIDEKNLTPSDYAVMATHLPINKTQEEVEEWFKEKLPALEIKYINYCYDINDIVRVARKLTFLQQTKAYLEAYKKRKLKKLGMSEHEAVSKEIDLSPPPRTL